ncbi:MAG TPA: hypothetical protein PK765_07815 [bacterium]|nr:hypothetical protein [bacterium]HRI36897.1 hypothetical protein [bacterium]
MLSQIQESRLLLASVSRALQDGLFDPVEHDNIVALLLEVWRTSGRSDALALSNALASLRAGLETALIPIEYSDSVTRDMDLSGTDETEAEICNSITLMSAIVLDQIKHTHALTDTDS